MSKFAPIHLDENRPNPLAILDMEQLLHDAMVERIDYALREYGYHLTRSELKAIVERLA